MKFISVNVRRFYQFEPAQREAICDWLKKNKIDPGECCEVRIVQEGVCAATLYLRNDQGNRYLDLATHEAAREEFLFESVDPPPWVHWI